MPARKTAAWVFEGKIYDLISLRPVFSARISVPAGGKMITAWTDEEGFYSIKVPALKQGGYAANISHEDYEKSFLDEIDPPYRSLELDERKGLRKLGAASHKPWIGRAGKKTRRDFVLTPRSPSVPDDAGHGAP